MYDQYGAMTNGGQKPAPKKTWWIVLIAVAALALVAVAVILLLNGSEKKKAAETSEVSAAPAVLSPMRVEDVTPPVEKVKNPIDFKKLQKKNPDLYAWIRMPGTVIDYPVAQSAPDEEEDFYLHRGEDKEYLFEGTIYSQKCNNKDFYDPNTILYGHCMKNGTMFRALHDLKVQEVWDSTPVFYIYTPDRVLTYRIFSAYTRDDRHIMTENDFFRNKKLFADYLDKIQHPAYGMTRDCKVTTNDHIVTLETCVTANGNTRFVVTGVLEKEQWTE